MSRYVVLMGLVFAGLASAGPIVQNLGGSSVSGISFIFGESLITPSGGPWDDLAFNFYSDAPPVTPLAAGNAFLLTELYSGNPSGLSSSTPGFVAESTGISGGQYLFAPGVEVLPDTTYWIYETAPMNPSGGNVVPGEISYTANNSMSGYAPGSATANFTLDGTVVTGVPEPSGFVLLSVGLGMIGVLRHAKRGRQRS